MKTLKLYWSSGLKDDRPNFGDWLSPLLCEFLSQRRVEHARPNRCDLVAVGSILHRLGHRWFNRRVHVWGTGLIEQSQPFCSRHYYHALRGKKTLACIVPAPAAPALGDPGLLCHLLLPDRPVKKYALGVVPHYKDRRHPVITEFLDRNKHAFVIDVLDEPCVVIEQIAQCNMVISSSLHGLVVADSLGVPNVWIRPSQNVRGSDFKFHDYYGIFDIVPQPFPLTGQTQLDNVLATAADHCRPGLVRIQADLLAAFPFRP
jgi:hypothetical protein